MKKDQTLSEMQVEIAIDIVSVMHNLIDEYVTGAYSFESHNLRFAMPRYITDMLLRQLNNRQFTAQQYFDSRKERIIFRGGRGRPRV